MGKMVYVNESLCKGCGSCARICPVQAIKVNGTAHIDLDQCTGCELCVEACPEGAIAVVTEGEERPVQERAEVAGVPEVRVVTGEGPSLRSRVLPVVGAALAFAAREVVPRLLDYVAEGGMDRLASRAGGVVRSSSGGSKGTRIPIRVIGGGRGRKYRWRGGRRT